MIDIGPAAASDLDAIRQLHTDSWHDAYAPFVPPDALDRLDAEMAARWASLPGGVILARSGDGLMGFVRLKTRQGWPYIDNLHTRPDLRGSGIGGRLMKAAATELSTAGQGRVWLTVIAGNVRARAFYAKRGGIEAAPMREDVLGHPTDTRAVIWNRLHPLLVKNGNGGVVRA